MEYRDGARVRATRPITDRSGDDPNYNVRPGDHGTMRSLGGPPPSPNEYGVEWDKYPGVINAVPPGSVASA